MQFQKIVKQDNQSAYALKDGVSVHISEVRKGLACGCNCPKCEESLIARKGPIRIHHFAHQKGSNCVGATETILHILAKELISCLDWIHIPPYNYKRKKQLRKGSKTLITHEEKLASGGRVKIDKVNIERNVGNIRPDIVVFHKNRPLAIEIAVTHKAEKKKKRLFRKYKMPAIEIQLSYEHASLDRKRLEDLIQKDTETKHWLFHPKQTQADLAFLAKVRGILAETRNSKMRLLRNDYRRNDTKPVSGFISGIPPKFKALNKADSVGELFRKKHGRYPSRDEMLRYWPELFDPKNKN